MRHFLTIIFFIILSNFVFGQKVYSAEREAYKTNKFIYEFYLFSDSTCFLKGHYFDNSVYHISKGRLTKINDTLFKFTYQPIVNFTCNKGIRSKDSLRFYFTQQDTIISAPTYTVKAETGIKGIVSLKTGCTTIFVKGSEKQAFFIDTKFIDPLTKKVIVFTANTNSDPDFTYYGVKTQSTTTTISLIKNMLTIYPDKKYIDDKDTFIRRR